MNSIGKMNKKSKTINVLGIPIVSFSHVDIFDYLLEGLNGSRQISISKCPSEFLQRALKNTEFNQCLNKSTLSIADGVGVLWASRYLAMPITKNPILKPVQAIFQMVTSGAGLVFKPKSAKKVLPERLSGVEVFYTMLEACIKAKKSVFFFGAREDIIKKSVEIIQKKYPGLQIAGYQHGYGDKGVNDIKKINESKASLLIVALGSPEQEYWIRDNFKHLKHVRVAVGEGGTFDAIAGSVKRAPKFIQKIGLEWLWRGLMAPNLTTDAPPRLKRIWRAVPLFIYETVKWKITHSAKAQDEE